MTETIIEASVWVLPLVFAITFHEAAHGFVAWRLGDDTAFRMGRVTFNPLKHIDLFGTIIIPALLISSPSPFVFGYAKPVPVNFRALKRPRRDMVLVALAGPGTNIALAVISALLMHIANLVPGETGVWLIKTLLTSVWLNLMLAVFNMLPLPPLDGGRVAVGLLPREFAMPLARLERYGIFILIGVIFLLPSVPAKMGLEVNMLAWVIGVPVSSLLQAILTITGTGYILS